ncbi:AB-hydrolase lipase domain [Sesbania bispinosa]|nr:AB-hydrolase lipase domain [Sesbania bispinosa]
MAFLGLFVALAICLVVSTHGSFGRKNVVDGPSNGICDSSVTTHGYQCQELEVTTKDGYILTLQRIPEGRTSKVSGNEAKEPVILQHGVMVEFWNWTWDDLVTYDLPAVFDYVSNQTGQKINFVGQSLGTLIALAAFSEGKLVNQLKSAVLLSPIAYLNNLNAVLLNIAARRYVDKKLLAFGKAEFDPKGAICTTILRIICAFPGIDCSNLLTRLTGPNCCVEPGTVSQYLVNEPQSTSTMNLAHLAQTIRTGTLAKYDYGTPQDNQAHYGQDTPPLYNLTNIPNNIPLFISYGGQDALADVTDVKNLLDNYLNSHDKDKLIVQFIPEYAHYDFIMGNNANDRVYKDVTAFLKRTF